MWVRGHSRSFKLVPFESFVAVSYLHSIVYLETFTRHSSSKYSVTLKSGYGLFKSLKMAPFDRPYTTFYRFAIGNTAISCTVFELFDFE